MKGIEANLERIANALEKLANGAVFGMVDAPAEAPAKKAAEAAGKAADAVEKSTKTHETAELQVPAVTREDVQAALVDFVNENGKPAAKEILGEFNAGSISTLKPEDYTAFCGRLVEVAYPATEPA